MRADLPRTMHRRLDVIRVVKTADSDAHIRPAFCVKIDRGPAIAANWRRPALDVAKLLGDPWVSLKSSALKLANAKTGAPEIRLQIEQWQYPASNTFTASHRIAPQKQPPVIVFADIVTSDTLNV